MPIAGEDVALPDGSIRDWSDQMGPKLAFQNCLLRGIIGVLVVSALFFARPAQAAEELNLNDAGVAIHGYDPVAYFEAGKPVKGLPNLTTAFNGAVYFFSSENNRRKFRETPEIYAPAYGGWCSMGVRVGRKFDVDPVAFKIVGQRLYLQLDLGTQKVWAEDIDRNIAIADRIWPSIRSVPAGQLAE